jgi:hypothetical protein
MRGGGTLRRSESPVAFWTWTGGMLAGSVAAFVVVMLVVIPARPWEGGKP